MQKSLSYSKGITTSPSGMLTDDTELVELVGMVYKSGEMHPIQLPFPLSGTVTNKVVYIHKGPDYCNAILYDKVLGNITFAEVDFEKSSIEETQQEGISIGKSLNNISSVGNTLIVATDKGFAYLLYKGGTYKYLGNELPKPRVKFRTSAPIIESLVTKKSQLCDIDYLVDHPTVGAYYNDDGSFSHLGSNALEAGTRYETFRPKDDRVDDLQTAISGHVSLILNLVKEKNAFAFPFFVRFALRLFDGTYARISAPVAVFPTITRNNYIVPVGWKNHEVVEDTGSALKLLYCPSYVKLQYQVGGEDIDEWSDIVKDIVVFASDEVLPFNVDDNWSIMNPEQTNNTEVVDFLGMRYDEAVFRGNARKKIVFNLNTFPARDIVLPKKFKTEDEIIDELLAKTQFFKLFSVKIDKIYNTVWKDAPIKQGVVSALLQQEQLSVDDYYGWTRMKPESMYSYNKRLNLFGVKRYPFKGFSSFIANSDIVQRDCRLQYFVHIVSDTMDTWVVSDMVETLKEVANSWFYYPDTNATEVIVYDSKSAASFRIPLQRHERLNGAYAFRTLPLYSTITNENVSRPSPDPTAYEFLSSQIFTSIVNNPFVFQASGDNTVGTGNILGIVANTEPISQGQFGQYPLLVFTTEGIYGMSVSSEGLYAASYPISREVCNNAASITPTGSVVFFTSAKGLMAVSGGKVTCVSDKLRGRNPSQFLEVGNGDFLGYLRDSLIAYDYRDSLLHIINPKEQYEYVYSIHDGTFAKASLPGKVIAVVNNYPDNIIQLNDATVLSLTSKPDINDDTTLYSGTFTTRPLKLGSSLQLKTIHQILHLFDTANGKIALRIYGSNDCRNWCELHSLHGKPWKYYTLSYKLSNMLATDAFAGTVVDFQPLFTEKMR